MNIQMDDLMGKIQDVLNDEESMNQIKKLASMLSSENSDEKPDLSSVLNGNNNNSEDENGENSQSNDFDFSKIIMLQQLLSQANKRDQNTDFLYALKPILKNENQVKIDRVIKILKLLTLWPVIKDSGILGGDFFELL